MIKSRRKLFYTTQEMALLLKLSPRTILDEIYKGKDGKFPHAFQGDVKAPWIIPAWDVFPDIEVQHYLNVYDYSAKSGIHPASIRWRAQHGMIPDAQKCGHYWLIPANYKWEDY